MYREKECIGVINVLQGQATSKQIEQQFMMFVGSSSWKWNARQVGDNRFVMRFPNAKMVSDWSKVKALAMTDVDARLEPRLFCNKHGSGCLIYQLISGPSGLLPKWVR